MPTVTTVKRPGRGRLFLFTALIVLVVCVGAIVVFFAMLPRVGKQAIVSALERQYRSTVEIQSLAISGFPHPHATGKGLVFRQNGRADRPPLITLQGFEATARWFGLLLIPHRISTIRLDGLQIHVSHGAETTDKGGTHRRPDLVVGEILADGAHLEILPAKSGKEPLQFDIYKLSLHSAGVNRPMRYDAQLRNPKPPGLIDAAGDFGPWDAGDPGRTPVTGHYRFSGADLGVFKGIGGKLSSTGEFTGPLERIEVRGQTDTPGFFVKSGSHPVDLKTTFSATVDGENGDTLLHPVTACFGETTVVAEGAVTQGPGGKGRMVSLDATVKDGSLADVLSLAVKSNPPPMTGRVSFHSKIIVPPGDGDIIDRLKLDGQFDVDSGKFTHAALEQKVSELSERARGNTQASGSLGTVTDLTGKFALDSGIIRLTGLSFRIPGAAIRLSGTYGLKTEELNFHGTVTTQAELSEMTTGVKSFLLKALDPLFKKKTAGAVIPIHIGGTRGNPSVSLDIRHGTRTE